MANGSSTKKLKNIRIEATCTCVKATNPFFISINEQPQINAKSSIAAHCQRFFDKLNICLN
jgi:hypothetical protein